MNQGSQRMRRAFTMMELLVVIGIIAVLLGILFPVVSKLRKSAYGASTGQTINTLTAAINAYQAVFQAYPGPFDFSRPAGTRYTIGTSPAFTSGGTPIQPTSSESLVLGLSGGVNVVIGTGGSITTFEYVSSKVGNGPVSLNGQRPRQYQVFVDAGSKLTDPSDVADTATDTIVPEFVDSFPEPKPILYVRANRGASGTAAQYDASLFGYGLTFPTAEFTAAQYYGDPSFNNLEPRQKDQFILISAGADGKYGTKDDITNFGSPGH